MVGDIVNNIKEKKTHQIAPNELVGNETLGNASYAHFHGRRG